MIRNEFRAGKALIYHRNFSNLLDQAAIGINTFIQVVEQYY
jgi:hypothetical protein